MYFVFLFGFNNESDLLGFLQYGAEVKIAGNVWDESNAHAIELAKDPGRSTFNRKIVLISCNICLQIL